VVRGLGHDGAVVLEPAIDARHAVPRERLEVLLHGMKRVSVSHEAQGVDDALLAERDAPHLLEP
jgi:hypothetical protein